jgi:SAM-dependent methyltransferase
MKSDYFWLNKWENTLSGMDKNCALELGCGKGKDSRIISQWFKKVIATDNRSVQIENNKQLVSNVFFQTMDHGNPLPFDAASFSFVLASLSLHYFTWIKTCDIFFEIHRVLKTNGLFIARVNSVNDTNWGATGFPEIEPRLYDVNGQYKRFFNRQEVKNLLKKKWELISLCENTIDRYNKSKVVWEFAVRKT